ncbi:MAG: CHRD domain-containing protein, partial [Cyanobacteria bacterium P01_D01_bin.50]
HCGRPDQLGPILIDFANSSNIQKNFADGTFEVELRNEDIEKVSNSGRGIVGAFTAGCPIVPGIPDNVKTIAGMKYIAQKGELYFNLHTKAQTFYGDIRGKLHPVT